MAENRKIDAPTGVETVGHEWDGIEELNNPLPRWWLWTLVATHVWALGYTIAYPAWPLLSSATAGTLGWSSRGQLNQEMQAEAQRRAPTLSAISRTSLADIMADPKLHVAAKEGGKAAYKVNCVQCHGNSATGSKGIANLQDDDWLWGGDIDSIHYTIMHGIRNPDHDATRMSQMPAYGRDNLLTQTQITDVANYVMTLGGKQTADASSARGATVFAEQCAACHGPAGKGDRAQGAPNLTDGIWLNGTPGKAFTAADVAAQVSRGPGGVMPRWNSRLDPTTIKMLAVYVHSLGGGEATPVATQTADAAPAPTAKTNDTGSKQ